MSFTFLGIDNEAEAKVFGEKISRLARDHLLALNDSAMVVRGASGGRRAGHPRGVRAATPLGGEQ